MTLAKAAEAEQPAPSLTLTRLWPNVPEPVEIAPGLIEVKLYVGNLQHYLMQNHRRAYSTRLALDLPEGYAMRIWPGPGLSDPLGAARVDRMICVDPATEFVYQSTPELVIALRNLGFGALRPVDWELSVLLQVVRLEPISLEVGMTDEAIKEQERLASLAKAKTAAA